MKQSRYLLIAVLALLFTVAGWAQTEAEIFQIQGEGVISPFFNQQVATSGIVTAIGNDRFFIQTPDGAGDNDPLTSDGLMVYTGTGAGLSTGDLVRVIGRVIEYEGMTEISDEGLSIEVLQQGLPLPAPVWLDDTFPGTINLPLPALEPVEGMYVAVADAVLTAPSDDRGRAWMNAGGNRTFREAGISYPGQDGLPVWDGNPELIWFDPNRLLNDRPTFSAGNRCTLEGVLQEDDRGYQVLATSYQLSGNPVLRPVREREARELSVGSLNTLVFSKNEPAYATRKAKLARYIAFQMRSPDILAVQEVQSLTVLEELKEDIEMLDPDVRYQAFLIPGSSTSGFSIQTGFLVSDALQNITIDQLGENQSISTGGRLHDRPPLLLEAEFKTPDPTPIAVLNLHIRSLGGIEGSQSFFVRTKRHEQAISIARIIQTLRNRNLVVTGDFNAFPFSDGYVDVMSQISGQPSLGAEFEPQEIVSPPLTIYSEQIPQSERYSYIFQGNSQVLDNILCAELQGMEVKGMEYARGNSDNPESFLYEADVPYRVSDHDGLVLFLELEDTINYHSGPEIIDELSIVLPNPFRPSTSRIRIGLPEESMMKLYLYSLDGRLAFQQTAELVPAGYSDWQLPAGLPQAFYILRVRGANFDEIRKVFISD